jgi:hypothetical protein
MFREPNGQEIDEPKQLLSRLQEQHRYYSQQLESLLNKPYLSEDEKLEEVRLKKLKLRIKDRIYGVIPSTANREISGAVYRNT